MSRNQHTDPPVEIKNISVPYFRPKIKICGLTRPEDIAAVNVYHPDFAGFLFAPSRRQISPELAKDLIAGLDPLIIPIGVFVDMEPMAAAEIAHYCDLGAVQLHGQESDLDIQLLRALLPPELLVIKALRVKDASSLEQAENIPADILLLDAYHAEAAGGTGLCFPWALIKDFPRPYFLAGGLNPGNVQSAISLLHPWGVDVSSGVETDGQKDRGKIRDFIAACSESRTPDA